MFLRLRRYNVLIKRNNFKYYKIYSGVHIMKNCSYRTRSITDKLFNLYTLYTVTGLNVTIKFLLSRFSYSVYININHYHNYSICVRKSSSGCNLIWIPNTFYMHLYNLRHNNYIKNLISYAYILFASSQMCAC